MRKYTFSRLAVLSLSASLASACIGDKSGDEDDDDAAEVEGDEPGECSDGADNDGDGDFDCDDSDCYGSPVCDDDDTGSGGGDGGDDGGDDGGGDDSDSDGDGYSSAEGDCDDSDPSVNPGEAEICNNKDDDCNGEVDDDPSNGSVYYEDWDADGYGDPDYPASYCDDDDAAADSYVSNNEDCDDVDSSIYPGAPENSGDGEDSNCDGYDANLEGCLAESVEDALNYVSYWTYGVADDSGSEYFGAVNWYIWNQILLVEGNSTSTSATSDPLTYDVQVGTYLAMNDYDYPYWVEVDVLGSSEYCFGWIDWTTLNFTGDVELIIDGSNVAGYADLSAASNITESDITLESYYGGACELSLIDTALDYAGYGGLLDFQEESVNSVVDALASELESEIEWYVDYNCAE